MPCHGGQEKSVNFLWELSHKYFDSTANSYVGICHQVKNDKHVCEQDIVNHLRCGSERLSSESQTDVKFLRADLSLRLSQNTFDT